MSTTFCGHYAQGKAACMYARQCARHMHYAKGKVKSSNIGQYATGGGGISTTK